MNKFNLSEEDWETVKKLADERSEEHTSELQSLRPSRMPSSA